MGVLKLLSKHGANMSAEDRWQVTPLQEATRAGHLKAEALINSFLSDTDSLFGGDNESVVSCQQASSKLQSVHRMCVVTAATLIGSLERLLEDDESSAAS